MGLLENLKFDIWDSIGTIENFIKEWKPKDCKTEKDYEESLHDYLEKRLEGKNITRQYGVGRAKVDLAIDKKVFVELKKDLKNTVQLQRLIGQLELYAKDLDNMIVVITGEVDRDLFKQLIDKKKDYDNDAVGLFKKFDCRILQK